MYKVLALVTIALIMVGCGGVRLPDNYAYVLDQAADSNEAILNAIKLEDLNAQGRSQILNDLVIEDIKTLRAAAETIRKGGGN